MTSWGKHSFLIIGKIGQARLRLDNWHDGAIHVFFIYSHVSKLMVVILWSLISGNGRNT